MADCRATRIRLSSKNAVRTFRTSLTLASMLALAGCGGSSLIASSATPRPTNGAGSIHAVVQGASGQTRNLTVDYAAAGLSSPLAENDDGSLVVVGVFRDGRVDDALDLETLSISVPMSELPGRTGPLDVVVDGANLNVLLEGAADSGARVITPDVVKGSLHLHYDAPPRPGITVRGDFSLALVSGGSTIRLDGDLEVPVVGN